jgi:hypothetical protein
MTKYVVINPDGTYAGVLCNSREEAVDLAAQKKGRVIGLITPLPMVEHIHCPVNGFDCPYWNSGVCQLDNPMEDCDDFASMWDEDDDYICDGGSGCDVWDMGE